MNLKVLKALEFDKILESLEKFATGEYVREKIHKIKPICDYDEVVKICDETDEAVRTMLKHSNPPSVGISDHIFLLKRTVTA